jgi:glycosyltransferase involved in cell wall biosynthesis
VGDEFRRPARASEIEQACVALDVRPGGYLLAVGNISTRKNLITLVRALAEVEARDIPLVLAGRPGIGAAEVDEEIRRHRVADRIRFTGFVPDAELPALVQGALALVHAAVDEGFGLPPLEAMAAGTPVIAARAGSIPEVLGDAALLVDPLDAKAWTEAIDLVAADAACRVQMAAAGRSRASDFTWQRVAEQTVAVHRSAMADALR